MHVLFTCKNEDDQIKNEGAIRSQDIEQNQILTSIKGRNSVANLRKCKLIQAFMHVLDTCKNEEDPIKNEGAKVFTRFLPL